MKQPSSKQSAIFSPRTTAAVVRYHVQEVERSVDFYTQHLGFQLTQRSGPIAVVSRGDLHLLLSGPGSSGSRAMPDGRRQEPGGWNRIVAYVESLDSVLTRLTAARARLRNDVEAGPGGKQVLIEDPDGNPIELHEAPADKSYDRWRVEHAFALVPAQAYVGAHLATYKEYPPRQKPGSFSLDQVLAKLHENSGGSK